MSDSDSSKQLGGYVGFANLPNQVHRKSVKKGFEFTLMVVGESGLGKSTLVNSLFLTDLYNEREYPSAAERIEKTVKVSSTSVEIEEKGVRLRLTIVDTPGFGDAVNNQDSWASIVTFIDERFEEFLNDELRVNRTKTNDNRVHCCLYFIAPNGHGLKPLDIEFMKRLHKKVNIIPVIGKADTLTADEIKSFRRQILSQIAENDISIYQFATDSDDEEDAIREAQSLQASVPFAVVGSNTVLEIGGKKVRGRMYPWGIVEVENEDHCDFTKLRNLLIRTHMQDLKDNTNDVLYESYRAFKLTGMGGSLPGGDKTLAKFEEEKREHEQKMAKMEDDMRQVFQMKVAEKEQKLKLSEREMQQKHEDEVRRLEKQKKDLDEKKQQLENERKEFEAAKNTPKKDKKVSKIF
ncbi:CDC10 protein [Capsaspora owczarzaki ATCC 30864]|uniref:CDC10 protein n=1 Tax=Capsaspora owczarzaki (strain ATCC 30864) TaxID=595528 RepID=UPI000352327E|nr:CDC10 protein [Capsaspora owczarzaki ATCC 30864]|eukprot:XP_004349897.2 CDC10 protein [Capsaspora owczarzaki ATCC 30864]